VAPIGLNSIWNGAAVLAHVRPGMNARLRSIVEPPPANFVELKAAQ
jgi:hypothetical protein